MLNYHSKVKRSPLPILMSFIFLFNLLNFCCCNRANAAQPSDISDSSYNIYDPSDSSDSSDFDLLPLILAPQPTLALLEKKFPELPARHNANCETSPDTNSASFESETRPPSRRSNRVSSGDETSVTSEDESSQDVEPDCCCCNIA